MTSVTCSVSSRPMPSFQRGYMALGVHLAGGARHFPNLPQGSPGPVPRAGPDRATSSRRALAPAWLTHARTLRRALARAGAPGNRPPAPMRPQPCAHRGHAEPRPCQPSLPRRLWRSSTCPAGGCSGEARAGSTASRRRAGCAARGRRAGEELRRVGGAAPFPLPG